MCGGGECGGGGGGGAGGQAAQARVSSPQGGAKLPTPGYPGGKLPRPGYFNPLHQPI